MSGIVPPEPKLRRLRKVALRFLIMHVSSWEKLDKPVLFNFWKCLHEVVSEEFASLTLNFSESVLKTYFNKWLRCDAKRSSQNHITQLGIKSPKSPAVRIWRDYIIWTVSVLETSTFMWLHFISFKPAWLVSYIHYKPGHYHSGPTKAGRLLLVSLILDVDTIRISLAIGHLFWNLFWSRNWLSRKTISSHLSEGEKSW